MRNRIALVIDTVGACLFTYLLTQDTSKGFVIVDSFLLAWFILMAFLLVVGDD